MPLQVRITNFDGSDPIILDRAENISLFESVNSSDEGVNFDIAKNNPKANVVNPDEGGYTKFWEVWDTDDNERKNYGSITTISDRGTKWGVQGLGRSNLLSDFRKTKKTFYAPIDLIVEDLRFENISIQPRTTTVVPKTNATGSQLLVFGTVDIDEKYNGLSKQTKDNVIDDDNGLIKPGQIEPSNTYATTDSFWAGMSREDTLIMDLGEVYTVDKVQIIMPTWGGAERKGNRTYDFKLAYADLTGSPGAVIDGRRFGQFHQFFDTGADSRLVIGANNPATFHFGSTASGTGLDLLNYYVQQGDTGGADMRYLRAQIYDVHAWYGSVLDDNPPNDGWTFQCDPDYTPGSLPWLDPDLEGIMADKTINERVLEPANDCFASIIEFSAYKQILERDEIQPLALQRIDSNNLQVTYSHIPDASETVNTDGGFRKFEPGGFFRNFSVTYTGANTSHSKFYDDDCTNCYPSAFNFGIIDQNNSLILRRTQSSGTGVSVKGSAFTSHILMKGSTDAEVVSVDTWPSVTDPFSWGGSYSFTTIQDDFATVHFRGQSFKWYATIPEDETGAEVSIEIRNKDSNGEWTSYSTLESSLFLPNAINAEVVYEITYESGTLLPNTVYEIRITNLDGGYCSIDSFEGYWSGSMTDYNEDSNRINVSAPENLVQIYDSRFSHGSMSKWNNNTFFNFSFEGDRVVLLSAKGYNHGKIRIILLKNNKFIYDDFPNNGNVFIPGGDPDDGSLAIDLDTGAPGVEIPQFVAFDSNDYFPDGLPWDRYVLGIYLLPADIETYMTSEPADSDTFKLRCSDCTPALGDEVEINKYVYLDGIMVHEKVGLSIAFENETHLDILRSVAEVTQTEWDVTEEGIKLVPRLGVDTNEALREGQNALVDWGIVNDVTKVASILISSGADIDGLPLFTITEDKRNREILGRTVMRQEDFRSIADYFQLIGISRTELRKRRFPEKRITVTHTGTFNLNKGDSFILFTKKSGPIRVRIMKKQVTQTSNNGRTYELECIKWPLIV